LFYCWFFSAAICPKFEQQQEHLSIPIIQILINSSFKGVLQKVTLFSFGIKPFPLHILCFWDLKSHTFKKIMRNIK
jgi:hypothetical protein